MNAFKMCVAGLSLAFAMPTFACSICRCGDPTFNALGKEGVAQSGFRLAVDWDQVRKTQGDEDVDSLRERRYSLLAAYGFSDRFSVFARLPYSERDLTETEDGEVEHESASGLADPEIYAQYRVWASPFEGDVGMRASLYVVGGVKTAWGENDASRNGERLDEHVQPGTGSTDWFAGLSGSYQLDPKSALFVSTQYRHTGRNDAGYQYGRTTLVNVAYERKLVRAGMPCSKQTGAMPDVMRSIARARSTRTPVARSPMSRHVCCSTSVTAGSCGRRRSCRSRSPGCTVSRTKKPSSTSV